MSEPIEPLAVVHTYDELLAAPRQRAIDLDTSLETIDAVAGPACALHRQRLGLLARMLVMLKADAKFTDAHERPMAAAQCGLAGHVHQGVPSE
jgi:hypothetical protein